MSVYEVIGYCGILFYTWCDRVCVCVCVIDDNVALELTAVFFRVVVSGIFIEIKRIEYRFL